MAKAKRKRLPAFAVGQQVDLFSVLVAPVVIAWGAGVDSTAMIIEMLRRGERIDVVIFADVGNEDPGTYAFIPIFQAFLARHNVPLVIVRREVTRYKNFPAYRTLEEECLMRGTLPSKAFGGGSCSDSWKIKPQEKWVKNWQPAIDAWAAGLQVTTCVGFNCSPGDNKRYRKSVRKKKKQADASKSDQPPPMERFVTRHPLREWGWRREDCIACIQAAGLPVPPKSACSFCPVKKPHELHMMPLEGLRRIVLLETRGKKKALTIKGLWRRPVLGKRRDTVPHSGDMTTYIRQHNLLPAEQIDRIIALAVPSLDFWVESRIAELAALEVKSSNKKEQELNRMQRSSLRRELREWLDRFDIVSNNGLHEPPTEFPDWELIAYGADHCLPVGLTGLTPEPALPATTAVQS